MSFSSQKSAPKKNPHPKHEADTAKASQRDALGSLLGTFSSEKVQYPPVAKYSLPIAESKTSEAKLVRTVPYGSQRLGIKNHGL